MKISDWMVIVILILVSLGWALMLGGCAKVDLRGPPLQSLCVMDFDAGKCWVDKAIGDGKDFEDMQKHQDACKENPELPCWYGINTDDLKRFIKR